MCALAFAAQHVEIAHQSHARPHAGRRCDSTARQKCFSADRSRFLGNFSRRDSTRYTDRRSHRNIVAIPTWARIDSACQPCRLSKSPANTGSSHCQMRRLGKSSRLRHVYRNTMAPLLPLRQHASAIKRTKAHRTSDATIFPGECCRCRNLASVMLILRRSRILR